MPRTKTTAMTAKKLHDVYGRILPPHDAPAETTAPAHGGIRMLKQGEGVMSEEERKARLAKPTAKERALAGKYRLIHGRIAMPKPESERLLADGSANPNVDPIMYIEAGAELDLDDETAARLEDQGLIEPLSVSKVHSRLGKVWQPPVAVRM